MWASAVGSVVRGVVVLVTAVGVVLAGAPLAAHASDDDRLMLSADGVVWARDLDVPIFDPAHLWVPGDLSTHTVWARNGAGESAEVFGELDLSGEAASLFTVRVRVDERPWSEDHQSEAITLAAGQVAQVQLQVTMRTDAANPRQQVAVPVSASITLRSVEGSTPTDPDQETPGPGAGEQPVPGDGELADTGTSVGWIALVAALVSVVGWWLVALARRRGGQEREGAQSIAS